MIHLSVKSVLFLIFLLILFTLGSLTSFYILKTFSKPTQPVQKFKVPIKIEKDGVTKVGPAGCTTEDLCRDFCSDLNNFTICKEFAVSIGEDFKGPNGCESASLCKDYCKEHEKECQKFFTSSDGNQFRSGKGINTFKFLLEFIFNSVSTLSSLIPRPG